MQYSQISQSCVAFDQGILAVSFDAVKNCLN